MRALLIAAGLFFTMFGGGLVYFAMSGTGHEYDLKLVLPIDTRQMPKPVSLPVAPQVPDPDFSSAAVGGRAEAGPPAAAPDRPPVQFGDRPGAASEGPSR
ncbi:MAG: hypothetical protein WCD20_00180 [Rhodomicrobium sp.]